MTTEGGGGDSALGGRGPYGRLAGIVDITKNLKRSLWTAYKEAESCLVSSIIFVTGRLSTAGNVHPPRARGKKIESL